MDTRLPIKSNLIVGRTFPMQVTIEAVVISSASKCVTKFMPLFDLHSRSAAIEAYKHQFPLHPQEASHQARFQLPRSSLSTVDSILVIVPDCWERILETFRHGHIESLPKIA